MLSGNINSSSQSVKDETGLTDSRSSQIKDYKNWYPQLSSLMFSNKRQYEATTVCGKHLNKQVCRRQLDSKTANTFVIPAKAICNKDAFLVRTMCRDGNKINELPIQVVN